jgi:hypothetical protein
LVSYGKQTLQVSAVFEEGARPPPLSYLLHFVLELGLVYLGKIKTINYKISKIKPKHTVSTIH